MKGLVYKDLRLLRGTLLIYIPLIILLYLFAPNSTFASSFTSVMLLVLPTSCFGVDEVCGWDKYAATLPAGRKAVVGARYVLVLLLLGGIMALTALASLLPQASRTMNGPFASLISTLAFIMVELPLIYQFGRKLWTYLISALVCAPLIFLAIFLTDLAGAMAWPIFLVLAAVGCIISYQISCSIVAKSEY